MKEQRYWVYTPKINRQSAFLQRRIAWATGKPMTVTLDSCIGSMVQHLDKGVVCAACKDRRCLTCPLYTT